MKLFFQLVKISLEEFVVDIYVNGEKRTQIKLSPTEFQTLLTVLLLGQNNFSQPQEFQILWDEYHFNIERQTYVMGPPPPQQAA